MSSHHQYQPAYEPDRFTLGWRTWLLIWTLVGVGFGIAGIIGKFLG